MKSYFKVYFGTLAVITTPTYKFSKPCHHKSWTAQKYQFSGSFRFRDCVKGGGSPLKG